MVSMLLEPWFAIVASIIFVAAALTVLNYWDAFQAWRLERKRREQRAAEVERWLIARQQMRADRHREGVDESDSF